MPKLIRFSPETAQEIIFHGARQVGLPVEMQAVQDGVAKLVSWMYQQGIRFDVDETSPNFGYFYQKFGAGAVQVRPIAQAGQVPGNGNRYQNNSAQMPPGAALPGQPLPPMSPALPPLSQVAQTPPRMSPVPAVPAAAHFSQPLPALPGPGAISPQAPGTPVPVQAPMMVPGAGELPGMTEGV